MTSVWPDVDDRRLIAAFARVINYLFFWMFITRVVSCFFIILAITRCIGHQYISLCNYFMSLNDIFEGDGSQDEKEKRYEDAFKDGIKMHSICLWCVRQAQDACGTGFSLHIVMNLLTLCSMMMQMMNAQNGVNMAAIVAMAMSVLLGTSFFMWSAGDITVEAAELPSAIFFSGWHNCQASTTRMRKLVTITLTQAQQPVIMTALGVIELSYESYLAIVKGSYSLFSVTY